MCLQTLQYITLKHVIGGSGFSILLDCGVDFRLLLIRYLESFSNVSLYDQIKEK